MASLSGIRARGYTYGSTNGVTLVQGYVGTISRGLIECDVSAGWIRKSSQLATRATARRSDSALPKRGCPELRSPLHRQRPGRAWLRRGDRLLWAWLYRAWPRCLEVMILVKPATVVQWHHQGFRKYWRWRSSSRRVGRPGVNRAMSPRMLKFE